MSKSGANLLLIFQCPGICPTPSQVDKLVSDDSPAFSPTMYEGLDGGVWYSLFIKNLAHYSSH